MAQHSTTLQDTMPVEIARSPNDKKIYISDLAEGVQEDELLAVCATYGKVKNIWVAPGSPRCAFVEFHRAKDAADIVSDLNGEVFCGRKLRVDLYTKKKSPSAKDKKRRSRKDDGSRRTPVQYRKHRKLSSSSSNKSSKSPSTNNTFDKIPSRRYSTSPQPPDEQSYRSKSSSQWSPIDGIYPVKEKIISNKRKRPPSPPYEPESKYKRAKSRPRVSSPFSPPSLPPYETERTYERVKSKARLRSPFSPPSHSPPKRQYSTKAESPFSRRYDRASPSEYGVRPYTPSSCSGSCCRDKQYKESQYTDVYYQGSSPSISAYERTSHTHRRSLSRTSPDSTKTRDDSYQRGGFGTRRARSRYRGGSTRGFHSESHHDDSNSADKWNSKPAGSRGFSRGRGRGRGRGFKPRGEDSWNSRKEDNSTTTWNSSKTWDEDWDNMDKSKTQSPKKTAVTYDEEDWDNMDKNKTQSPRKTAVKYDEEDWDNMDKNKTQSPRKTAVKYDEEDWGKMDKNKTQSPRKTAVKYDEEDWDNEDTNKASNTNVKTQAEGSWDSPKGNNSQNKWKAATNCDEDWGSTNKNKSQKQRQPIVTCDEDDWDNIDVKKSSNTSTKTHMDESRDNREEKNKNNWDEDWSVMDKNKLRGPGKPTAKFDDDDWDNIETNKPSNTRNKTSGQDEINWDRKETKNRSLSKPAASFEEENWDCVDVKPIKSTIDPDEENWDCSDTGKSTISRQPALKSEYEKAANLKPEASPNYNEWESTNKPHRQQPRKKAMNSDRYINQVSGEENWDSDDTKNPMISQDVKLETTQDNTLAKTSSNIKKKHPHNNEDDCDDINASASNQSYPVAKSSKSTRVDCDNAKKAASPNKSAAICNEDNWECAEVNKSSTSSKLSVWSDVENWDDECPKKSSISTKPVEFSSSSANNDWREKSSKDCEVSATQIEEYNWEPIAIQKPSTSKKTQVYQDEEDWDSPASPKKSVSSKHISTEQVNSRGQDAEDNWKTNRKSESRNIDVPKATVDDFNWECIDIKKSTSAKPSAYSDEEDWDRPASNKPSNLNKSHDNYKTKERDVKQNYEGDWDSPVSNVPTSSNKFRADYKASDWAEKRHSEDWDKAASSRPYSSKKPRGGYKSNEWDRNKSKSTKSLSTYEEPNWDSNFDTSKDFKSRKSYENRQYGGKYPAKETAKAPNTYSQDDWDYSGSNRPPSPQSPAAHHSFDRKWEDVSQSSSRPDEKDWYSARSTSRTRSVASYDTADSDSRRSYTPKPRKSSTFYDEDSRNVKGSYNPFGSRESTGSDRMKADTYKSSLKPGKRHNEDDWNKASTSNSRNSSQSYNEGGTNRFRWSNPNLNKCSEESWDNLDVQKSNSKQVEARNEKYNWVRTEANKPATPAAINDEENWDSVDVSKPVNQINDSNWDSVDASNKQKNSTKNFDSTKQEKCKIQDSWDSDQDSNGAHERMDNNEENWEGSDTKKTPSPKFSPASNIQSSPSSRSDLPTSLADDDWEANDLNFEAIVSEIAGAISDDDFNFLEDETSVENPSPKSEEMVMKDDEKNGECASTSKQPTVINERTSPDKDLDYQPDTEDQPGSKLPAFNDRENNDSKLDNSYYSTHSERKSLDDSQERKSRSKCRSREVDKHSTGKSRENSSEHATRSDYEDCGNTSKNRCDTSNSVNTGVTPDDGNWD